MSADESNSAMMQGTGNHQYPMQVDENPMTMIGAPSNGKVQIAPKAIPSRQCKAQIFSVYACPIPLTQIITHIDLLVTIYIVPVEKNLYPIVSHLRIRI